MENMHADTILRLPLWRDAAEELPHQGRTVLLLVRGGTERPQYLALGYHTKQFGWLTHTGNRVSRGLIGWMPEADAIECLSRARRGQ
jgi:hypothetical protein